MATVPVTVDTFPQTVAANPIVFTVFFANWCPACREYMPVYKYAAQRHPDIVFGTADTTVPEQHKVAGWFGLQYIPTTVVVKHGVLVDYQVSGIPAQQLANLIRDVRACDPQELQAAAAAAAQPAPPGKVLGASRLR